MGASLVGGLVGVLQSYLSTRMSQGISFDIRQQLFGRLLVQSIGFYTRRRSGDLMSRIYYDAIGVQGVVGDTLFGIVSSVFTLVSTFALMVVLDWQLTLVTVVMLPLVLGPSHFVGRATYRVRKQSQEKFGEIASYLQETLGISGILLVKAFTKERSEKYRFQVLNQEFRRLEIAQNMVGRWFGMLTGMLSSLSPAVLLLVGGYLVINGQTTVGTVITMVTVLSGRLGGAVAQLANTYVNLTGSLALFGRIFQVLDLTPDVVDRPDAQVLTDVRGAVRFEGVSFTYPGTRSPHCAASLSASSRDSWSPSLGQVARAKPPPAICWPAFRSDAGACAAGRH